MIELYTWKTSNGRKASIMLEEIGLPYNVHPIHIGKDDQFTPEFVKINPNSKIPAIVDTDGPGGKPYTLFESGAILMYLAEKTGKLMPQETAARYQVIQWLMFQMGGVGPMLGQAHHFNAYAPDRFPPEQIDYGRNRYVNEANRVYGVIDRRLKGREWIAADQYSIADMAIFPWLRDPAKQGVDIAEFPEVERWRQKIWKRPAVVGALEVLKDRGRRGPMSDKQWEIMYGATQRTQGGAAAE